MEWFRHKKMNEEVFLNLYLLASDKTACVCIVFFFHYFKYGKNIFSRTMVPYLIAKVEGKE